MMKPAVEWISAVGEAVMFSAFVPQHPPGEQAEKIVEKIQADVLQWVIQSYRESLHDVDADFKDVFLEDVQAKLQALTKP